MEPMAPIVRRMHVVGTGNESDKGSFERLNVGTLSGRQERWGPTPVFFVSVASKGVSSSVSRLFATVTGESISVAAKGLTGKIGAGALV